MNEQEPRLGGEAGRARLRGPGRPAGRARAHRRPRHGLHGARGAAMRCRRRRRGRRRRARRRGRALEPRAIGHLAGAPLVDPRVRVIVGDVADVIAHARERYDAILLDVDNGPEALTTFGNKRLYAEGGLRTARGRCGRAASWPSGRCSRTPASARGSARPASTSRSERVDGGRRLAPPARAVAGTPGGLSPERMMAFETAIDGLPDPRRLIGAALRGAHLGNGHSSAAPRTPLASPCAARTSFVRRSLGTVQRSHSWGTLRRCARCWRRRRPGRWRAGPAC